MYQFKNVHIFTNEAGKKMVSVHVECEKNARGTPSAITGLDSAGCIWIEVPFNTNPQVIVQRVRDEIKKKAEERKEEILFLAALQQHRITP